jgi:hypothetical protein
MTNDKAELRKQFNDFLLDKFVAEGDKVGGQTHRWAFCFDFGNTAVNDCACCLNSEEIEGCGCICHNRISQIVDFIPSQRTSCLPKG